jgi:hypothetical protein
MDLPAGKDLFDWATLGIAVWGAGIASWLGYKELRREKRSLKIILERINWVERYQILITNVGHRPVTIIEVHLGLAMKNTPAYDMVPTGAFWAYEEGYEEPKFPIVLKDGKMAQLHLRKLLARN